MRQRANLCRALLVLSGAAEGRRLRRGGGTGRGSAAGGAGTPRRRRRQEQPPSPAADRLTAPGGSDGLRGSAAARVAVVGADGRSAGRAGDATAAACGAGPLVVD